MYSLFGIHFRRWLWLFSVLTFFIRTRIYPRSLTKESFAKELNERAVVYILPRMSIMDILVLNKVLKLFGQKKVYFEALPKTFQRSAVMALQPRSFLFYSRRKDWFIEQFLHLYRYDPRVKDDKVVFVPVSVFWSRAPERQEQGFLLRSLFPDDGTGNGLQKLLMLLLHRGEVNIAFGKVFGAKQLQIQESPAVKNDVIQQSLNSAQLRAVEWRFARRMQRQFNIEFAKERAAAFGPGLYDKEKICKWILSSPVTKKFLQTVENPIKTEERIVKYIHEISANYNYVTIRSLEKIFDFIWNHVFDGVQVYNFESVERIAKEGQVVWMPSHRSHFDYLLLSYVLFKRGFVIPHIAAGINLNFWPIGPILRRGGAFFIRRSFAGNRIYAHTFSAYVNFLMQNSFPIEFFQEGGRSRIGKLLTPKTGMLSISLQSILQRKAVNTSFIPISFCYEKVMEENSYAKELRGAKKQKENAWQFLNGIRKIFVNYGSAAVSFGEPLNVGEIWREYITSLKKGMVDKNHFVKNLPEQLSDLPESYDTRDPQIQNFIKYLAVRINQKINCAAIASNTAILATVILAQKEKNTSREHLESLMQLLRGLINNFGAALGWKLSTNKISENIADFDKWTNPNKEFNLWWYRGTIFHTVAAFGIIAHFLLQKDAAERTRSNVEANMALLRRLWQDELFWDHNTSTAQITAACLTIMTKLGYISIDLGNDLILLNETQSLEFMVRFVQPEIELFGIQLSSALMLMRSKGCFSRDELGHKAFAVHSTAFSKSLLSLQPIFSKVFAQRIFDAFYKEGIFIPGESQKLHLQAGALGGLTEFFALKL